MKPKQTTSALQQVIEITVHQGTWTSKNQQEQKWLLLWKTKKKKRIKNKTKQKETFLWLIGLFSFALQRNWQTQWDTGNKEQDLVKKSDLYYDIKGILHLLPKFGEHVLCSISK